MAALAQTPQSSTTALPALDGALKDGPSNAAVASQDPLRIVTTVATQLESALSTGDFDAAVQLFDDEGYWKDQIALHWDFKTVQGHAKIGSFLGDNGARARTLNNIQVEKPSAQFTAGIKGEQLVMAFFTFDTDVGKGRGVFRLRKSKNGSWRIFALYTTLQEIRGHEPKLGERRALGVEHGQHVGRKSWKDRRAEEKEYIDRSPEVLIVGAGQAGLSASARLKHLGVDALMIDANKRVGDNWRKRYDFLVLHDPIWYDHLPLLKFPPSHPVYTPKDKLADWFEFYASTLELNHWMETTIVKDSVAYDEAKKQWTVTVRRNTPDGVQERTLHPDHIIMATGHSGEPNMPAFKGADDFKGRLVHSSQHGSGAEFKGKKAIVIGCCNSGHDIAQDFYEQGADVTIVQRSSTYVMSSDSITEILFKGLYCEDGPPTEDADLMFVSTPNPVHQELHKEITAKIADFDKDLLSGLSNAGFKLDMGFDGSGFLMKYYRRGGGYYLDVGASKLIMDGKIKIKQGQEIDHLEPDGVVFADGHKLEADVIVCATGYQNMRTTARKIFGDKVADRLKLAWGLDDDEELSAMYRFSGHPRFYYMGGNLAHCRSYSLPLALQIQAQQLGMY
ncbi:uncharacterized protein PFL1_03939 [Pseudozyma flocculosa PF-1]|uniref:Related to flavin-containing monooxygenase n=2 Tax=Pseudozyma flocculosa TaxID=84751 RepID=A0A5C3F012_9BASI|nr:uncharacterized protein PFL1_03939 [Pseudozyma flocculosa PF-1]EPQ28636.1 hypothetical protein PFL1_03939 [Pseudozyma flocculosa PF-1]SPO36581.1 related to flavin-containing monooxygenase [Pseudozyma flocculosa]